MWVVSSDIGLFGMPTDVILQLITLASSVLSGILAIVIGVVNHRAKDRITRLNAHITGMENKHQFEMDAMRNDFNRDMRMFGLLEQQIKTTQSQSDNIHELAEATREQTKTQSDAQSATVKALEQLTGFIKVSEARYQALDEHVSKMDELSLNVIEKAVPLTNKVQKLIETLGSELATLKQHCSDDVKGELNAVERRIRGDIKDLLNEFNQIKKSQEDVRHETNDSGNSISDSASDAVVGVVDDTISSASDGAGNDKSNG